MNPKKQKVVPSNNRNRILLKKKEGIEKQKRYFYNFKKWKQ